jgi:lysozyme family protein
MSYEAEGRRERGETEGRRERGEKRLQTVIVLSEETLDDAKQLPALAKDKPKSIDNERLDECLAIIFDIEGGYSDHARDNGGPTNHGITQATLSRYRGAPASVADVKALMTGEAVDIYEELFWTRAECDKLPPGIDLIIFDQAVHSGPYVAQQLLQEVLNETTNYRLAVDGDIGQKTAKALATENYHVIIDAYSHKVMNRYKRLEDWDVFGRGWTNRNERVTKAANLAVQQDARNIGTSGVAERPSTTKAARPTRSDENGNAMNLLISLLTGSRGYKTYIGIIGYAAVYLIDVHVPSMFSDKMDATLMTLAVAIGGVGARDTAQQLLEALGYAPKPNTKKDFQPFNNK